MTEVCTRGCWPEQAELRQQLARFYERNENLAQAIAQWKKLADSQTTIARGNWMRPSSTSR
jgi:hypothetical protein